MANTLLSAGFACVLIVVNGSGFAQEKELPPEVKKALQDIENSKRNLAQPGKKKLLLNALKGADRLIVTMVWFGADDKKAKPKDFVLQGSQTIEDLFRNLDFEDGYGP